MKKEEAILKLAVLGHTRAEIEEFIRVEKLRRTALEETRIKMATSAILMGMEL